MPSPLRILAVDDSPSIRRLIAQSLSAHGFEVLACESAEAALELAGREHIDAVVTDLNMPGLDGMALTRQLRTLRNTARCPILILTTDNSAARKQEAKQAGASGWILKPFQAETLLLAIGRVCQRAEAGR
ncbi:MAG: hypothetical protein DCC67_11935 [Planctomycetota bacterium]|nr:MAG: hypothetical protein DCC67_11935 [Planctomycetota bacterium]